MSGRAALAVGASLIQGALALAIGGGVRSTKPSSYLASIKIDTSDMPEAQPNGVWLEGKTSPHGSLTFEAFSEQGDTISVATVYAAMGLPSDDLDEQWLASGPRAFELFELETAVGFRQQGHASRLVQFVLHWLVERYPREVSDVIFARDASDIDGLYSGWGWVATDREYPHCFVHQLPRSSPSHT